MKNKRIDSIIIKYPFMKDFFKENGLNIIGSEEKTIDEFIISLDEIEREKLGNKEDFISGLELFIQQMISFTGMDNEIDSISILPGKNKDGKTEEFSEITIKKSEIVSIVGPTGSGKSRLLADIEWTAKNDTPTNRAILINGKEADIKWRYSANNKLVAQLSQNMNFVMDLTVKDFITLHAKSRMVEDIDSMVSRVIDAANNLSGEMFSLNTAITALSGGQSRALMIADTAILSSSPIILIDEIENAGVDRKRALDLLVSKDKIVLIATHDPTLALMADRRIIIKNGGIDKIIKTSPEEKRALEKLEEIDKILQNMRTKLRSGEEIEI